MFHWELVEGVYNETVVSCRFYTVLAFELSLLALCSFALLATRLPYLILVGFH
jgi:hypothetical protein